MAFQLQGGNPASNDYDYQSGSGMDNFMSRSIDEVSWQANLGSVYNSLSELPIGLSPTSATPTNYDQTQISGSQSATTTLGGAGTGNSTGLAVANIPSNQLTAGIQIQAGSNNITVNDGTNNRAIVGYNPTTGTWGAFATPPGTDITNANTPEQLSFSTDYSQMIMVIEGIVNFPAISGIAGQEMYQTATIPHGQSVVPAYYVFLQWIAGGTFLNLPTTYYTQVLSGLVESDNAGTSSSFEVGIDQTNLYINRLVSNSSNFTAAPANLTYQILANTASSNIKTANVTTTSGLLVL